MSVIYHVLLLDGSNFEVTLDVSQTLSLIIFSVSVLIGEKDYAYNR